MKTVWLSVCLLFYLIFQLNAVSYEDWARSQWLEFKAMHGKNYSTPIEEILRKKIFFDNRYMIARHNEKYAKGMVSFSLKMNAYGDLLQEEFVSMMNGVKPGSLERDELTNGSTFLPPENQAGPMPKQVDWTSTLVTEVKDQGHCGACWAFSTTGSLEGQYARKTGKLVSLSEQNLVDCSDEDYNNHGCAGGLMDRAFLYIYINGGIDTEESYPYEALQGPCRFQRKDVGATLSGYVRIMPRGDETLLAKAVAFMGPVSAAVFGKLPNFRFYAQGVYDDQECSHYPVDHGVLIVGYGTTEMGQKYWLIKNSWGKTWGEQGYMKLARDASNLCGISTLASVPLV